MSPRRYAVFGLLDDSTVLAVRPLQEQFAAKTGNDLALRFPVHITLRGRFWGEPESVITAFQRARSGWECRDLVLTGPVFQSPDLLWLSVEANGSGYAELGRLHAIIDAALSPIVTLDETAAAHAGVGYRPHVTLAWGATDEMVQGWGSQESLHIPTRLVRVVLAEYPESWPSNGSLQLVSEWGDPNTRS